MIGKAYVSVFKYYDVTNNKMGFKNRPVLIIGEADKTDFVALPISRITNNANIDSYYDFAIEPKDFPLMNLKQRSYIRTHKQTILNISELTKEIVDFRKEYGEVYLEIISRMEVFQKKIIDNAL